MSSARHAFTLLCAYLREAAPAFSSTTARPGRGPLGNSSARRRAQALLDISCAPVAIKYLQPVVTSLEKLNEQTGTESPDLPDDRAEHKVRQEESRHHKTGLMHQRFQRVPDLRAISTDPPDPSSAAAATS